MDSEWRPSPQSLFPMLRLATMAASAAPRAPYRLRPYRRPERTDEETSENRRRAVHRRSFVDTPTDDFIRIEVAGIQTHGFHRSLYKLPVGPRASFGLALKTPALHQGGCRPGLRVPSRSQRIPALSLLADRFNAFKAGTL